MPYLEPRSESYWLPARQSLSDGGSWSVKFLSSLIYLMISDCEPLASFCKDFPIKSTIVLALSSSMQGMMVVGSGSQFYWKSPYNARSRISWSVREGRSGTLEMEKLANNRRMRNLLIKFINRLYIVPHKLLRSHINANGLDELLNTSI